MTQKISIVWLRNDLRLHDNLPFYEAVQKSDIVIPVYIFDTRHFGNSEYKSLKCGIHKAKFLIETVQDLKNNLKKIGADLVVKIGKPEEILVSLALKYQVQNVYHHTEVAREEINTSEIVEKCLWKHKVTLKYFIGHTLFHKEDLPFLIKDIPDIFTNFRKKTEKETSIRDCVPTINQFTIPDNLDNTILPTLYQLDIEEVECESIVKGGETTAMERIDHYFWKNDLLKTYKETRNGLLGMDYSSKLSPWLALGAISPKYIYHEVKKYEVKRVENDSTYWLIFELIWRDYFRFMFKKYGDRFFFQGGFKGIKSKKNPLEDTLLLAWKNAQTGIPFIDANMKELNQTGFMSNRGRQNVASFLVKDLKVNWMLGAAYFEEKLIDYCPASNWGNWAYVAGVGNDPREDRYFNIPKQAGMYDPNADYIKFWLPELKSMPAELINKMDTLTNTDLKKFGVILGSNYPFPIVKFEFKAK